jgi:hypothetical protein
MLPDTRWYGSFSLFFYMELVPKIYPYLSVTPCICIQWNDLWLPALSVSACMFCSSHAVALFTYLHGCLVCVRSCATWTMKMYLDHSFTGERREWNKGIVACTKPLPGYDIVNYLSAQQWLLTQQRDTLSRGDVTQQDENCWEGCFLCGLCWGVISRTSLRFS